MGGDGTDNVKKYAVGGAKLIPVTISTENGLIKLLEMNPMPKLTDEKSACGVDEFLPAW